MCWGFWVAEKGRRWSEWGRWNCTQTSLTSHSAKANKRYFSRSPLDPRSGSNSFEKEGFYLHLSTYDLLLWSLLPWSINCTVYWCRWAWAHLPSYSRSSFSTIKPRLTTLLSLKEGRASHMIFIFLSLNHSHSKIWWLSQTRGCWVCSWCSSLGASLQPREGTFCFSKKKDNFVICVAWKKQHFLSYKFGSCKSNGEFSQWVFRCSLYQGNRRETRLLGILSFVHSTVWKVLFGKVSHDLWIELVAKSLSMDSGSWLALF